MLCVDCSIWKILFYKPLTDCCEIVVNFIKKSLDDEVGYLSSIISRSASTAEAFFRLVNVLFTCQIFRPLLLHFSILFL